MTLPIMQVGNPFEIWLNDQWMNLLSESNRSIVVIQEQISTPLTQLRYLPIAINTHGMALADYLCLFQYINTAGGRYGPWSFMSQSEWKVIARITELECWECDEQWWNRQ